MCGPSRGRHNTCYTCHQVYDRSASAKRRMNELDDGCVLIGEDSSNHKNNMMWLYRPAKG